MQATIKEKLNKIKEEYEFLEEKLNDPNVISDIDQFSKYNKQKAKLENKYQLYSKYLNLNETINDSLEIIKNESDQQFIDLAKEELNLAKKEIEVVEEDLIEMLVELDPNDSKDAIIEIKGAVGGDEANIFAGDLYRMYSRYASKNDWNIEIIDSEETDRGGFSFIIFEIKGIDVYKHLKFESGVHRVQRVPQTETNGRVHTSTATVLVTPLHEEEEFSSIEIPQNEIRIDTYRASGAGGQHINKTDSAVRITHIPTGIVVSSQQGRSQHDNKDKAFKMLKSKILDLELSKKNKEINEAKKTLVGAGERSEKIRTYNYQQNRVSDHRINLTLKKLDRILQGNIDEIIEVLLASERELSN